ncbi:hypothetical protein SYNPS1DRAFT_27847 [Syncephalis pseudoplumigaleata]|uniref:Uncharacterized protein n=1 Tax=Syncephalis pseudoplumigaleata TaxID=1712513 RepID=A0A4V1J1W3_9FUNG|nr:hypothetical protein SYNPS1DRAFT_27847 [Syncephalis pseudoplumigaleata]|eukprot:RKP26459.1 hypothetical protein SYNPS1DRAFT_27847 [Syncephalis pseudoplumigaleata]
MACRVSLRIAHPLLTFHGLQLYNVHGASVPLAVPPESAAGCIDVPPRGMLFYRVCHQENAAVPGDPLIYFAMAWLFTDGKRKVFFADLVYIEQTLNAGADDMVALLATEIHRRGIGHPYWRGHLPVGGLEPIGCALRVRCSNRLPATMEITLSELPDMATALRGNYTLEPPLWHTTTSLPFTTIAGQYANDRLVHYLSTSQPPHATPPTIIVLENVHAQLHLHQAARHPQLLAEAALLPEKSGISSKNGISSSGSSIVAPNTASAFVAYTDPAARHSPYYYLVYTITRDMAKTPTRASPGGQPAMHAYFVITWTAAGTSRQFYAVEILNARLPLDPNSHEGTCALSLMTALSRSERGHCIQREAMLALPARTSMAVAAYLSLAWSPTLLIDVASIEKSTHRGGRRSYRGRTRSCRESRRVLTALCAIRIAARKSCLPSIKISIENAHPSLALLDFQCLTTENGYGHSTDGPDTEMEEIVSGGLHTFVFTPRSDRQMGMLLFRVQAAQPIARAPLLVVAWRQSSELSNDLYFHANVVEENAHGDRMGMLALDNLFATVYDHRKSIFAKQSEGTLANGMEYTVTATLRRHLHRKELEATVCFAGNISGSGNEDILTQVRMMAEEEAGEELVVAHQSSHPDLTLLNVQMYAFTGRITERPRSTVGTNDTVMARMQYDKQAVNTLDGSVKGFILAQIADKFGHPIPGNAHIIVAWRLKGPKRTFFVNALTFTKPPIPRLKDRQIQGRFFRQLIQPRLCLAGQDIIHHRLLLQNAPGIFLGATLHHRPLGQAGSSITLLHVVLRKASNLPLHALSAAPTLAKQRRTIRNMKRRTRQEEAAAAQPAASPSIKIIDNESVHEMDQLWPYVEADSTRQSARHSMMEEGERSILIINGSVTILNDDNSICARLYAEDEEAPAGSGDDRPQSMEHPAMEHGSHHSQQSDHASSHDASGDLSMDHRYSLGSIGLIPDKPPILDPLEFSSNRLAEAFSLFHLYDTSQSSPIMAETDIGMKGKLARQCTHGHIDVGEVPADAESASETTSPTTTIASSCPPDMLPLLLGGDVLRHRPPSSASSIIDGKEFTCRVVITNGMADAAIQPVGHYAEPPVQLRHAPPTHSEGKSLDWTFVANGPRHMIDMAIASSIHVEGEAGCLLWVVRVIAMGGVVSMGIASKRSHRSALPRMNAQTLQQIHQVIVCSPVLDGQLQRVFQLNERRNLAIRGTLANGLATSVQLVLTSEPSI